MYIGSLYFLVAGGIAFAFERAKPNSWLNLLFGINFIGPYVVGIFIALDDMLYFALFPPYAMWATTDALFHYLGF